MQHGPPDRPNGRQSKAAARLQHSFATSIRGAMSAPPPDPEHRQSLSEILQDLCDESHASETLSELLDRFGRRAFGPLLFVFAAPNLLPLPPGASTFLGAPLVLFTPQLAAGVETPWLPRAWRDRPFDMHALRGGFQRLLPLVGRIEHVPRARLTFLFGPVGDRLIGAVCTLLAFILMLPLVGGNLLPAAAISVFAIALIQRDGLLALLGYLLAAVSLGVLALAAGIIHRGIVSLVSGF